MKNSIGLKTGKRVGITVLAISAFALGYNNCSGSGGGGSSSSGVSSASGVVSQGVAQVALAVKVNDSSNNTVFNSSTAGANSNFVMKANQQYQVCVNPGSTPSGLAMSLILTPTSSIGAKPLPAIPLSNGCTNVSAPAQGNYQATFQATAPSMATVAINYNANVTCANPTNFSSQLKPALTATATNTNLYTYNAAGVVAGLSGATGPYQCAIDPTGTGIIDTNFQSCSTAFTNVYDNFVGTRNVNVTVTDSCNSQYSIATPINYGALGTPGNGLTPAQGVGNVFISGQTTGLNSGAIADLRSNNVSYLATNTAPSMTVVDPSFDGTNFTIKAAYTYGLASSTTFGVEIDLGGITSSGNTGNISVNTNGAKVTKVSYSTDENGGQQAAVQMSSTNCTLNAINSKVVNTLGTPCASGGGDTNQTNIEIWGQYTCTVLSNGNASEQIKITGYFDGLQNWADSCTGGGGGGGGVTPVGF